MRVAVATLACLLMAGCATAPAIVRVPVEVPVTVYETIPVPAALLQPCWKPLAPITTNAELEAALAGTVLALRACDADKAAIRELK